MNTDTEINSLVQALRDESDLCKNETALDVAELLADSANLIDAMQSDKARLDWLETTRQSDLQFYMSTEGPRWRFGSPYFDGKPWFPNIRAAIDAKRNS